MTDEVSLLKVLETRDGYLKYSRQVSENALSEEVQTLVQDIGVWFDTDPDRAKVCWSEFDPWFRIVRHNGFSSDKKKYFRALFERLSETEKTEPDKAIVERFRAVETATKVGDIAADVLQGHGDIALVDEVMGEWRRGRTEQDDDRHLKTPSISHILDKVARKGGINWRLQCLNNSLGPLHKGDFVVFGKRPESGGTSWIASELTFMAPQVQKVVIFNNEEAKEKIQLRLYQAALNKTAKELVEMEGEADARYAESLGGAAKIIVYDEPRISVREVEHFCREQRPDIIAFNTLPKVHGFHEEKNDIKRLQKLAQWARELAKEYGPVFGVWQADGTAEGEKWLDASKLAWSKTDVQGECDVLLMLGRTHSPSERAVRFLNIVKNKMAVLHEGEERHSQYVVKFDGERSRYDG